MSIRAMYGGFRDSIRKPMTEPVSFSISHTLLFIYIVFLFGSALGAYSIGFVPIQWLVNIGLIIVVVFVAFTHRLYVLPGIQPLLCLFIWGLFVTVLNVLFNDFARLVPSLATTPYPLFVSLRFLNIFSFTSAIYLVYWLCIKGYKESIIKWTVIIGTLISIGALYMYIAQIYGLPEPIRNRMSTGGGKQLAIYSYAFHRATGTFREPSHLAEWLVLPFFLSLVYARRTLNLSTVLIGSVLLLTGSLTGIIGGVMGFIGAMLFNIRFNFKKNFKIIFRFTLLLLFILAIFYAVVIPYKGGTKNIFQVIDQRLMPIMMEGPAGSNRDYIYQYVASAPLPLLGYGLGHANIILSQSLGISLMGSFLSLYLNFVYATGVMGLTLLCLFLFRPAIQAVRILKKPRLTNRFMFMSAAYFSWLVMFAVHSEEFCIMFGVTFALFTYEIYHQHTRWSVRP